MQQNLWEGGVKGKVTAVCLVHNEWDVDSMACQCQSCTTESSDQQQVQAAGTGSNSKQQLSAAITSSSHKQQMLQSGMHAGYTYVCKLGASMHAGVLTVKDV